MLVEFDDEDLERLFVDPESRLPGLGDDLVRAYRKVVGLVANAADERDLHALRALRFEKLQGKRAGQHSLRLNRQWRLIVRLVDAERGRTVVVVEVVDYH